MASQNNSSNAASGDETPELLYHTTLTVIDHHPDTCGTTHTVYPLGTHASLGAAKDFAAHALQTVLGYGPDDFEAYQARAPGSREPDPADIAQRTWTHGDGVVVYARASADRDLLVGLDTTPNSLGDVSCDGSGLISHKDGQPLHYVLQTKVDYGQNEAAASGNAGGGFQRTDIQGVYATREEAERAARRCVRNDPGEMALYDERRAVGNEPQQPQQQQAGWPFGEDVVVHAVALTGEDYAIAVRTVDEARQKFAKKRAKE